VAERTAGRLDEAHAFAGFGDVEGAPRLPVHLELIDPVAQLGRDQLGLNCAGGVPPEDRKYRRDVGVEHLEERVHFGFHRRVAGEVADDHAGQRADFHRVAFVPRRLEPGIGPALLRVRDGLSVVGVQVRSGAVAAVLDLFLDLVGVKRTELGAVCDTALQHELLVLVVEIEEPVGHEIGERSDLEVVFKGLGNGDNMLHVYVVDEVLDLADVLLVFPDHGACRDLGHAARHEADRVRGPAADGRDHLMRFHPHLERLHVPGDCGDVRIHVLDIEVSFIPGQEGGAGRHRVGPALLHLQFVLDP